MPNNTGTPAQTIAQKMIKVDHAGENGAVNIYRAQGLAAQIRTRSLLPQLREFQAHEMHHRTLFALYLKRQGVRRCVSYHMCGIGGFALGFVTGLIGPKAIYATTYAVENVVLKHLAHQLDYLKNNDAEAYDCVNEIYIDEQEHHDTAQSEVDPKNLMSRALIWVVKACTQGVIKFGMR